MRTLLLIDLTTAPTIAIDAEAVLANGNAVALAGDALQHLCARAKTFVGLGPIERQTFDADLAAAARAPIAGVALPHCRNGADLQHLAAKLAVVEAETGRRDGTLGIIAVVAGTPRAVLDLASLPDASRRLRAVVFDGMGLAASLPPEGAAFAMARALTLIAAKAADVPAYVLPATRDDEAIRDGFAGLVISHTSAI